MRIALGDLVGKEMEKKVVKSVKPKPDAYKLSLDFEKTPTNQPIYSRICKVKLEGLTTSFFIEEEVRPYSRRDNLLAHQSYWDSPLFKVFYRKLLNDVPKGSIFWVQSTQDVSSWEKACKKLGIVNGYKLKVLGKGNEN